MKIEKINKDRIMVTLTPTDLSDYNIDINALGPNSKELHSLLFNIMETIRAETGFNPYNGQVVVEATPHSDGVTLVVSKMGANQARIAIEEFKRNVKVTARLKSAEKTEKSKYATFSFANFDNVSMSLARIADDTLMDAALYKVDSTFCLAMKNREEHLRVIDLINEFADKVSYNSLRYVFIAEHGSLVAEGEKLVGMARLIRSLT